MARAIEPFVASPKRRIETIRALSRAEIRVTVNVAPLIPGLSDRDMPRILEAAAEAGASGAAMIMLRLPGPVKNVFETRLRSTMPLAAERVLARTREMRGGRLNDPRFGSRMTGEGEYAEMVNALFRSTVKKLGLGGENRHALYGSENTFRRPPKPGAQLSLFGERD